MTRLVLKVYNVLRYRYHSARVATNNRNVRISLANWRCKKVIGNLLYQLTRDLAAFPEIHEAFYMLSEYSQPVFQRE